MKNALHFFLVLFFALCLNTVTAGKANADSKICFTCHSQKLFTGPVIHQPVAKGDCNECHNPHVAKHKGLLQKKGTDFCFSCHQKEAKLFSEGVIHEPIKQGKCLVCHDPHVSNSKGLLKSQGIAESCFSCHEALPRQYKYVHKPFQQGQCISCHSPHTSNSYKLLAKDEDQLCFSCHTLAKLQNKHPNYPDILKNCLSCHHPHGSDSAFLVRNQLHKPYTQGCTPCHDKGQKGTDTCLGCHEQIKSQILSTHNHLNGSENSCVACHSPHAADSSNLLKAPQKNLCRDCHEESFRISEKKRHKHPDTGTCSNCHSVHGSNTIAMLKNGITGVCSGCHASQGQFTHPVGGAIVDPRNGQEMTCVTCHYPHGTDYTFFLKLSGAKALCIQCHKGY
ncbi:MAG: hypothetical protein KKE17_04410 [Proteobacteria bacterium]|nr:hypothetical protein [Pseudomonadota bacterium]MBU1709229.1 hypothetical protein [Pseudomonadota bacterium]